MRGQTLAIILIAVGVLGLLVISLSSALNPYYPPAPGFTNNGERIYFTATSSSGKPITATIGTMVMRGGMMSCASCHGADGKGGSGKMMTWTFKAPDIRYSTLTSGQEGEKPYTDELIKRAITQGIDSQGERLEPPMPVWQMSEGDLNDLIGFLKTLK